MTYGGFWKRFFAYIIDWLILLVISFVIAMAFGMFMGISNLNINDEAEITRFEAQANLASLLIAWLYYALLESSSRQATFGKSMLGMRVVDNQGNRISFGRATVRFFAKILSALLLFIGFIMIAFTERKQGLHDLIAGTLIINK